MTSARPEEFQHACMACPPPASPGEARLAERRFVAVEHDAAVECARLDQIELPCVGHRDASDSVLPMSWLDRVDSFGEFQYGLSDLLGRLLDGVMADAFKLNGGDFASGHLCGNERCSYRCAEPTNARCSWVKS